MPDENRPTGLSKDEIIASEEVMDNLTRFFPPERILPKTQFMIHEVIAALNPPA